MIGICWLNVTIIFFKKLSLLQNSIKPIRVILIKLFLL